MMIITSINITKAKAFDLFEAWEAALGYSADYSAAKHARDAEKEQKNQALAALLPQVSANAAYQKQPPDLSTNTRHHGWNIQASQVLFDKAKWAQYKEGKIVAKMADQKLASTEEEILYEVAQSYFKVLLNKDKLNSIKEEKKAYEHQINQAQAMFEKGAATIVDTNEAQAGLEAAKAKEISTQTELDVSETQLQSLTGLNPKEITPIKKLNRKDINKTLNKTTKEQWHAIAQNNNPEWQLQKLALKRAKEQLKAAQAGHYPKLTLTGGYQDNRNTQEYGSTEQHYRSKGGTVMVQLTVPLFTSGLISSQVREAAARKEQNKDLLIAIERKIKLAVDQAYQNTKGNEHQIKAQEQLLKANETKLNATKLGRSVGVRSSLDELQAQQSKAEAEQKLSEAKYNYILSYIQLLQNAGLLKDKEQQKIIRKLWE